MNWGYIRDRIELNVMSTYCISSIEYGSNDYFRCINIQEIIYRYVMFNGVKTISNDKIEDLIKEADKLLNT